jgi:hypothetical protein
MNVRLARSGCLFVQVQLVSVEAPPCNASVTSNGVTGDAPTWIWRGGVGEHVMPDTTERDGRSEAPPAARSGHFGCVYEQVTFTLSWLAVGT